MTFIFGTINIYDPFEAISIHIYHLTVNKVKFIFFGYKKE
jgi:hypothetical protein